MNKAYARYEPDHDRIADAQAIVKAEQDQPDLGQVMAVDPFGCGCTECLTGVYVPLHYATGEQLVAMILGEIENHTGYGLGEFQVLDNGTVLTPRDFEEADQRYLNR